ncbi:hypothetical protein CC79DRAFT_1363202 [Sarocladium strictum]
MPRVVIRETHHIPCKAQLWSPAKFAQGHDACRVIALKDVFFYHEYISQVPAATAKHKRQHEVTKVIWQVSAREQVSENPTQVEEASVKSAMHGVTTNNPLKASRPESFLSEMTLAVALGTSDHHDPYHFEKLHALCENFGSGLRIGPDVDDAAAKAFYNWSQELSPENPEALAVGLQRNDPTAPVLQAAIIQLANRMLRRPKPSPDAAMDGNDNEDNNNNEDKTTRTTTRTWNGLARI